MPQLCRDWPIRLMLETMLSSFENDSRELTLSLSGWLVTRFLSLTTLKLFPSLKCILPRPLMPSIVTSFSCPNHSGEYSDLTDVRVTHICGMLRIGQRALCASILHSCFNCTYLTFHSVTSCNTRVKETRVLHEVTNGTSLRSLNHLLLLDAGKSWIDWRIKNMNIPHIPENSSSCCR